jgi:hypothetical protein
MRIYSLREWAELPYQERVQCGDEVGQTVEGHIVAVGLDDTSRLKKNAAVVLKRPLHET